MVETHISSHYSVSTHPSTQAPLFPPVKDLQIVTTAAE